MRHITCRLASIAVAIISLLLPAAASATATPEQIEKSRNEGVTYLKGLQKESGEIPGFGGDWALTSLAAANVAAADVNKGGSRKARATTARPSTRPCSACWRWRTRRPPAGSSGSPG